MPRCDRGSRMGPIANVARADSGKLSTAPAAGIARAARAGFRFARIAEPLVLYRGREELDGAQLETTLRTSLMVLRRELAIRHRARPPWLRRQIIRLKVRGWYADQLLKAAEEEPTDATLCVTR